MSEATKTVFLLTWIIVVCALVGRLIGLHQGRAEMKRWQDEYYKRVVNDCTNRTWEIKPDGTRVYGHVEIFRGEVFCSIGAMQVDRGGVSLQKNDEGMKP
jgi:hypothetical protein